MGNHLLIYSITCLLSTYIVPGSVIDPGDTTVSKTDKNYYLYWTRSLVAQEKAIFIVLSWLSTSSPFIDVENEASRGEVTQPVRSWVEIWLHLSLISKSAVSTPPGWRERVHPCGSDFILQKACDTLVERSRIGIFCIEAWRNPLQDRNVIRRWGNLSHKSKWF